MAKTKQAMVRYLQPPSRPAPIVVRVPRMPSAPKAKHSRRRHHNGGSNTSDIIESVVAGAILGFIDKQGTAIPTIPILGRAGTIAVGAWMFRGKHKMIANVAKAAATIAAYELISAGSISGEVDGVASQV